MAEFLFPQTFIGSEAFVFKGNEASTRMVSLKRGFDI